MTHLSGLASVRAQHHPSREEDGDGREQKLVQKSAAPRTTHTSVLVNEVLQTLELASSDVALDATAGLGGHSEAMLRSGVGKVIALDADPRAVAMARTRLAPYGSRAVVIESNFRNAADALKDAGVESITKALFDLGWNMTQLDSGRGFSFLTNDPLTMSFGQEPASGFTAAQILNTWSEKALADVFFGYGEERYARRIAKRIVEVREATPVETTEQLVGIIQSAVPAVYRKGRVHPATRSFQALRIAVNDELGSIEKGITSVWDILAPGGRIAVITFHSIEDRAVKRLFAAYAKDRGKLVVKKPLIPSSAEIKNNPSARSAKLRVIEKIN